MKANDPVFVTFLVISAFGLVALCWPLIQRGLDARLRSRAIALHRQNWTHGQIAEELDRDPRQIARWLAEADRAGG